MNTGYWDRLSLRRQVISGAIIEGLSAFGMCLWAAHENPHINFPAFVFPSLIVGYFTYQISCGSYSRMRPPTPIRRFAAGASPGLAAGLGIGAIYSWGSWGEASTLFLGALIVVGVCFFVGILNILTIRPSPEPSSWPSTYCVGCRTRWKGYFVPEKEPSRDEQLEVQRQSDAPIHALSCDFCGSIRCLKCNIGSENKCPYCGRDETRMAWVFPD
jgi:hypothetical protein